MSVKRVASSRTLREEKRHHATKGASERGWRRRRDHSVSTQWAVVTARGARVGCDSVAKLAGVRCTCIQSGQWYQLASSDRNDSIGQSAGVQYTCTQPGRHSGESEPREAGGSEEARQADTNTKSTNAGAAKSSEEAPCKRRATVL